MKSKYSLSGFGMIAMVIAIGILIVVTVVGLFLQKTNMEKRQQENALESSTVVSITPGIAKEAMGTQQSTPKVISKTETTDAKIDSDFQDIDASLQAIDVEFSSIDQGLNDQMGDLSE